VVVTTAAVTTAVAMTVVERTVASTMRQTVAKQSWVVQAVLAPLPIDLRHQNLGEFLH